MSFTAEVKDEISKLENIDAENISELSGILSLFCEDGRSLTCGYDSSNNSFFTRYNNVSGLDSIVLSNPKISQSDDSKIYQYDLGNGLVCLFSSNSPCFNAIIQDIDCYRVNDQYILFDYDCISFGQYEVTLDGKNLLYKGVLSVPFEKLRDCFKIPFEKIDSLGDERETFKERFRQKYNQSSYTLKDMSSIQDSNSLLEELNCSIDNIDQALSDLSDEDFNNIIEKYGDSLFTMDDYYTFKLQSYSKNEMPICRKVIDIRGNLVNGSYRRRILSSEEITSLTDIFLDYYNGIIDKNTPVQKTKK